MIAPKVAEDLNGICSELDRGVFPRVQNGGVVTPNVPCGSSHDLGGAQNHDRAKSRGSEAGSRKGAAGRERSSYRTPGPASQGPPVLHEDLRTQYAAEVDAVKEAYPSAQVWEQDQGYWFLTESSLLPGLERKAVFLTGLRLSGVPAVLGWGFWNGTAWIGPRHTNFPEGSICAFERSDGTWNVGDPLIELFDLYTLWALRHLHLEYFGRWPGKQAVSEPYERVLELHPDELCGCGREGTRYGVCCAPADRRRDLVKEAVSFTLRYHGGLRRPPLAVQKFVTNQGPLPDLKMLIA